jgi:hypothetical protein
MPAAANLLSSSARLKTRRSRKAKIAERADQGTESMAGELQYMREQNQPDARLLTNKHRLVESCGRLHRWQASKHILQVLMAAE